MTTGMPTALHRLLTSPARFVTMMAAVTVIGLGLDRYASLGWQYVLAACTWVILIAACVPLSPEQRARTAVVVMVATIGEIIGSIIWGIYTYRLGNLPLFVPPGHGLVYLTGLRISQLRVARRHARAFVTFALTVLCGWGILGLTGVLGRHDVAGAMGCATLAAFILGSRRSAALYSGVFFAVAFLEIYGTAVGTWFWEEKIPGLGIPNGNPPSGAASGYVLFDICALAFGGALLAAARRLRPARPARPVAPIPEPESG